MSSNFFINKNKPFMLFPKIMLINNVINQQLAQICNLQKFAIK